jgi:hypothetical protein
MRVRICNLQCNLSVVRVAVDSLLSHLRLLGPLSVASYDSQGLRWKYSFPPPSPRVDTVPLLLYDCCFADPAENTLVYQAVTQQQL